MPHGHQHSRLDDDAIQEFWAAQAEEHGLHPTSSWSDHRAIDLEIDAISRYLEPGMRVLDAGCATGYSSVALARARDVRLHGIDYVPQMVELAEQRRSELEPELASRLRFSVGDVRNPAGLEEASFDVAITTRVLINLGSRDAQVEAVRRLGRLVRPGGMLLLSEATVEGWQRLNTLRNEWGLGSIGMPSFNLYVDRETVEEAAGTELELEAVEDFASSYFVVTRVLKPLLVQALGIDVDPADPDAELNRWAARLPAAGDYGTQKLFVLRRRG